MPRRPSVRLRQVDPSLCLHDALTRLGGSCIVSDLCGWLVVCLLSVGACFPRSAIWALALSPDGCTLFSGGEDRTIVARDALTLARLATFASKAPDPPLPIIFALEASPLGDVLYSGGVDNCVTIWDVKTGARRGVLKEGGHSGSVNAIAVSPGGDAVYSGRSSRERERERERASSNP